MSKKVMKKKTPLGKPLSIVATGQYPRGPWGEASPHDKEK